MDGFIALQVFRRRSSGPDHRAFAEAGPSSRAILAPAADRGSSRCRPRPASRPRRAARGRAPAVCDAAHADDRDLDARRDRRDLGERDRRGSPGPTARRCRRPATAGERRAPGASGHRAQRVDQRDRVRAALLRPPAAQRRHVGGVRASASRSAAWRVRARTPAHDALRAGAGRRRCRGPSSRSGRTRSARSPRSRSRSSQASTSSRELLAGRAHHVRDQRDGRERPSATQVAAQVAQLEEVLAQ